MEPSIEQFPYKHKRKEGTQEFMIKKKDYGTVVFFDIFYEETFLFSLAEDGTVLIDNWERAHEEPILLEEDTLKEITTFIIQKM